MHEARCNGGESEGVRPASPGARFCSGHVARNLSNKERYEGGNESTVDDKIPKNHGEGGGHAHAPCRAL
jgi:hypothetical protein